MQGKTNSIGFPSFLMDWLKIQYFTRFKKMLQIFSYKYILRMVQKQQELKTIPQLSQTLIWSGPELKKRSEEMIRQSVNKKIYLTTYVQAIPRLKNHLKDEKAYPAYLCLFKRQRDFVFGVVQKKVTDKKKKQKENLYLKELFITQLDFEFSNLSNILISQTFKRTIAFQIKFSNKFIRMRWFTLLKNLNSHLRKAYGDKIEDTIDLPQRWNISEESFLAFNSLQIFNRCRNLAIPFNSIVPIKYKSVVFYTIYAQCHYNNLENKHLQCLVMMHNHQGEVYIVIAYSNQQYSKCLTKGIPQKRAVQKKQNKKIQDVHVERFRLSQTDWIEPSGRIIILSYDKFQHQIYCKSPEVKDKWSILMLNQKYNRGAKPQIGKTFQIFQQLSQDQQIETVQRLLSANYPQQQFKFQKNQFINLQLANQDMQKTKKSRQSQQSIANQQAQYKLNQSIQSKLKQKDLVIQELKQQLQIKIDQKADLVNSIIKNIRESSLKSHVVDPSFLQLSQSNLSSIIQKLDEDPDLSKDLSVMKSQLLKIKESKLPEQPSFKQSSIDQLSFRREQVMIHQHYESSQQFILPKDILE